MNATQLASIVRLVAKQSTVADIVQATGMTRQTIYRALRALEREGVARIADWNRDDTGRAVEPVWALGSEPSLPKRKYSPAEKQKAYRARKAVGIQAMQAVAAVAVRYAQEPTSMKARRQ
jgi:DNA-binding transcriptional ArsR family regulator